MWSFSKIKEQYKNSLKSMDTEEFIDLAFYRPIGYMWATLCRKAGITPNAVTIASIFLGVAGGVLLYFHSDLIWLNYIGIFLIIWANSFDSADGQLARMTGQYSKLGRILDGVSGDLWFVAIYVAICLRVNECDSAFGEHPWIIWAIAIFAGFCHVKQAATADYYRQLHLHFLKGEEKSEFDNTRTLDERLRGVSWKKNFWSKFVLSCYRHYTANQENFSRNMQFMLGLLGETYGKTVPQSFREDFRRNSKPLMKYTNMLTFNVRIIALFVSVIIKMPWLYFLFELTVLNLLLVYLIYRHEKMCYYLSCEIDEGTYN